MTQGGCRPNGTARPHQGPCNTLAASGRPSASVYSIQKHLKTLSSVSFEPLETLGALGGDEEVRVVRCF